MSSSRAPEAFILAGGQSRRMRRNKALLELGGLPLLGRVIDAARPVASDVSLIANEPATYQSFGLTMFPDRWPGAAALGGIATAVFHARADRAMVLACDLPFLTPGLLGFLAAADPDADVTLFETAAEGLHPLCAVYSKRCLGPIERRIAEGKLKVAGFFPAVRVKTIDEAAMLASGFGPGLLANLNTPEDYEQARSG